MHNNFYFLRLLSERLAEMLLVPWFYGTPEATAFTSASSSGMTLAEAFSQDKDEIVLGFYYEKSEFYIRAVLSNSISCLTFPTEFYRAKRNSVDLFKDLQGLKVMAVVQHQNERSFVLHFENEYALFFKMHGRRSNLILFHHNEFVIGFHKKMEKDQDVDLALSDRPLAQDFEAFRVQAYQWKKLFPTFGKEVKAYLDAHKLSEKSPEEQWWLIQDTLRQLAGPPFYVYQWEESPTFTLLPPEQYQENKGQHRTFQEPLTAITAFYYQYARVLGLHKEKQEALKFLQRKIQQAQNYIDKNQTRLFAIEDSSRNEEAANILMANLHQIPKEATTVTLYDFYHEEERTIKLKKDLTPQKNAEVYYRKAKNEKIEKETLWRNLERKEKEISKLKQHLTQIETFDQVKPLRKYLKENDLLTKDKSAKPDLFPFKQFSYQGFQIWIGKNSKNNDLLTQQYAHKEDLWLHAKDVSGSHVVIKHQSGKPFPKDVIEKAAALAAYYSKRSRDSLCPVIYTPKKFVRKTKDLAPGQVLVEKEEVMMVVPEKF